MLSFCLDTETLLFRNIRSVAYTSELVSTSSVRVRDTVWAKDIKFEVLCFSFLYFFKQNLNLFILILVSNRPHCEDYRRIFLLSMSEIGTGDGK